MSNLSIDRQLPAYVPGAGSTALTPSPTGGVNFAQSLAQVQATPPKVLYVVSYCAPQKKHRYSYHTLS